MALRVVGAGLGRTGTHSLKLALEQLLGGPCYHMFEVFGHPDDIPVWHGAATGEATDWDALMADYRASVDWPAAAFWQELSQANPDAVVLLSVRDDSEAWWTSADQTIFSVMRREPPDDPIGAAQMAMIRAILTDRFTDRWDDRRSAIEAYERHNEKVRSTIPADRLLQWRPRDGWAPICQALDLAVPDGPFPQVNTTAEFRAMTGLDGAAP
jgi:hypothetical protein